VLEDRVLVFNGGPLGRPKSYVALTRSKLLSAKERARVAAMAGAAKIGGGETAADAGADKAHRAAGLRLWPGPKG
jgi:hypothetical protein